MTTVMSGGKNEEGKRGKTWREDAILETTRVRAEAANLDQQIGIRYLFGGTPPRAEEEDLHVVCMRG